MDNKDKSKSPESRLNVFQISNLLKLNQNTRNALKLKYKNELMSRESWKKRLKKERFI